MGSLRLGLIVLVSLSAVLAAEKKGDKNSVDFIKKRDTINSLENFKEEPDYTKNGTKRRSKNSLDHLKCKLR